MEEPHHLLEIYDGNNGEYLSCPLCGGAVMIKGETEKQQETHMMVALDELLQRDCDQKYSFSLENNGDLVIGNTLSGEVRKIKGTITIGDT